MLSQSQTSEFIKLLSLTPDQLENHVEITLSLRKNVVDIISHYKVSKEDIMSQCELSEAQYYRRMNNSNMWEPESLLKIVRLIRSNTKK